MQISPHAQRSPRFGALLLEEGWDKSLTEITTDNTPDKTAKVQQKREQLFKTLEHQKRYIAEELAVQLQDYEDKLGVDFIINTKTDFFESSNHFNGDKYQVTIVRQKDQSILAQSEKRELKGSVTLKNVGSAITSALDNLNSPLNLKLNSL